MPGVVCVRSYPAPAVNRREILRYAGVRGEAPGIEPLLDDCLREAAPLLVYRVCFREFPVTAQDGGLDLGFARTGSADLKRNLTGCPRLVLFAATVGLGPDRLVGKYSRLSPSRALLLQAVGAERIESLCDVFAQELAGEAAARGLSPRPRFSPGYGDFPLSVQREIFGALDCPRSIGVSLNESLLMTPSKSVTAVIGLAPAGQGNACPASGCGGCGRKDCSVRRET